MKIKRISESLYPFMVMLYKECFGIKVTERWVKALFRTEFTGVKHIGYMAIDEKDGRDVPVAYYGVLPLIMNIGGNNVLVAQGSAAMTITEYQKQGLFVELGNRVQALARENGIKLIFAFPNKNSFRGFEKMGWKFYDTMYRFDLKTPTLPVAEICQKYGFGKFYRKFVLRKILKYACYYKFCSFNEFIGVKKDQEYILYKIPLSDCFYIKYNDFYLFIKANGHLQIGDVEKFPFEMIYKFINAVQSLQKLLFCRTAVFYVNKNHWLYNYLHGIIPKKPSLPVGFYQINSEIEYGKVAFTLSDFDTF